MSHPDKFIFCYLQGRTCCRQAFFRIACTSLTQKTSSRSILLAILMILISWISGFPDFICGCCFAMLPQNKLHTSPGSFLHRIKKPLRTNLAITQGEALRSPFLHIKGREKMMPENWVSASQTSTSLGCLTLLCIFRPNQSLVKSMLWSNSWKCAFTC